MTWTSGTTGAPKPVLHTHANYLELLDRVLGPLRGSGEQRQQRAGRRPNLVPVSLALNAGIYNVLFGLRAGAEIVVMDGFEPRTFAELVRRFAIRSTVLPPAAMAMLSDAAGVTDLAPLRYVRSITAPLSPLQARRFTDKFGVVVLERLRAGRDRRGDRLDRGRRARASREARRGRPSASRACRSRSCRRTMPAATRTAVASGACSCGRRAPRSAIAADRVDADGFVDTGDLARVDDDGFVWIEGRAGDVINRGGNKVFPEHVEEVLRAGPRRRRGRGRRCARRPAGRGAASRTS